MSYIGYIFIFLLGTIIGSFLNVVIFRYNTNFTLGGRSFCLYCGKELKWYELIPLFSFLILKGRCATCKSQLSIQYPLVEFFTGVLFLLSFIYARDYMWGSFLYSLIYLFITVSILIIIFVYDIRHKIIPDGFVFSFIILSIFRPLIFPYAGEDMFWAFLAGPILALPFAILFFVSGGKWMGFGDAKLVLGIGWFLGILRGAISLLFSFWIGAVFSIVLLFLRGKQFTMKSEIPFAPFLIIGIAVALFVPVSYLLTILGF